VRKNRSKISNNLYPNASHPLSAAPLLPVDFADPGIFWDDQTECYYGYSTNANGKNVQCCTSKDFCSWQLSDHDALPGPFPPWTGKDGFRCWAPEVRKAPEGRPGYLMYFSTHDWNTEVMSVATAYSPQSPLGPFGFVGNGPIVSQVSFTMVVCLPRLEKHNFDPVPFSPTALKRVTKVEPLIHNRLQTQSATKRTSSLRMTEITIKLLKRGYGYRSCHQMDCLYSTLHAPSYNLLLVGTKT